MTRTDAEIEALYTEYLSVELAHHIEPNDAVYGLMKTIERTLCAELLRRQGGILIVNGTIHLRVHTVSISGVSHNYLKACALVTNAFAQIRVQRFEVEIKAARPHYLRELAERKHRSPGV